MLFKGVFVATVSPFESRTGDVDFTAYEAHLKTLSDSGVHGFVPCGTTGEGPCLSDFERKKLISISVDIARNRGLRVVAGCGSNSTSAALKMILEAKAQGADGALVVTPYYNKPTQEGLIAHYEFLAEKSPLPIVLYHVPGRTNVTFQLSTLKRLFQHPNIVGIKEASGNHGFWMGMTEVFDWKKKFVLAGDDDAFALIQRLGGQGIISATANVAPKEFVKIFEQSEAGNSGLAFEVQKRLLPLVQAMFAETNPSPVKEALKLLGRMENTVRLPLVPVSAKTKEWIEQSLKSLGYL